MNIALNNKGKVAVRKIYLKLLIKSKLFIMISHFISNFNAEIYVKNMLYFDFLYYKKKYCFSYNSLLFVLLLIKLNLQIFTDKPNSNILVRIE